MSAVEGIHIVIILLDHLSAPDDFLVIVLVKYQVGEVAVGKSHQDHVAVVVGTGSVALSLIDFVQHEKGLHYLIVGGEIVCQPQIALQCFGEVVDAVVEYVSGVKQTDGCLVQHRVDFLLALGQLFQVVCHVVRVVGVTLWVQSRGSVAF